MQQIDSKIARLISGESPFALAPASNGGMDFIHPPHTLDAIYARAQRFGSRMFIQYGDTGWSFTDFFQYTSTIQSRITSTRQIGPPDRVGLLAVDGPEWIAAFVAITALGAEAVLLQPPRAIAALADIPPLDLICCDARHAAVLAAAKLNVPQCPIDAPARTVADAPLLLHPAAPDDHAFGAFTSGSSGTAKCAVHTHRSAVAALRTMMLGGALRSALRPAGAALRPPQRPAARPSALVLAPLFHVAGYSQFLLSMLTGNPIMLPDGTEPALLLAMIAARAPSSIAGATAETLRGLILADEGGHALDSLTTLFLHGAALRPAFVAMLERSLPDVQLMTGYGLTETGGSIAVAGVAELAEHPGTCGTPTPNLELRITDGNGAEVPTGEWGRLFVRGPMVMAGYDTRDGLAGIGPGGWFDTGDTARIDSHGALFVRDRFGSAVAEEQLDDLNAVEAWLLDRSDVLEARVLLPDAARGASRIALVHAPGHPITADAITDSLIERFGEARTWHVAVLPALPRTASGKIDHGAVEASFAAAARS